MQINEIRKRLESCPIPMGAQADWRFSNHYEITDPIVTHEHEGDYFWLEADPARVFRFDSEEGRRLGAVLDAACNYPRDIRYLLSVIDGLMAERPNEA